MKEPPFPKSDIPIINQYLATHGSVKSLLGKLAVILEASSQLIENSEKEYPKRTINVLTAKSNRSLLEKNFSITDKIHIASGLSLIELLSNNHLTSSYLEILRNLAEIQKSINYVVTAPGWNGPFCEGINNLEDIKSCIQNKEFLKNEEFLNYVVPLFLTTNVYCYQIHRYLAKQNGSTIDQHVARARSSKGGKAGMYGEDYLKSDISKYISEINVQVKYANISDLFNKNHLELGNVLISYKERLGSPAIKGGEPLTYGHNLTEEGLKRKLRQWAKEKDFKETLERICKNY